MSRFNTAENQPQQVNQPIVSVASPTARTGNSAPGFVRDAKSELFLLAVNNFVGQDKFYESGKAGDNRFRDLVRQVAQEDPDWMARFLPWLRNEANMRTASIVGALEFASQLSALPTNPSRKQAMHARGIGRVTVDVVLQRADEPGEALAYWMSTYRGKQIPKPIKRGVADAATRLYNEFNTLKYDTASKALRFGDVLELTHASPEWEFQKVLFRHLIDRRHGRDEIPSSLGMIHANAKLRERAARGDLRGLWEPDELKAAGMTWEDALSLAGNKVPKDKLWEAMIPNMGYMAVLRNLRNFDQAGVSDQVARKVIDKLVDPHQVKGSRQFPFRFLSAFRATANNLRWGYALEQALNLSLGNVPSFPGRTLVLVDQSPSMFPGHHFSTKNTSDISLADQAKIFGTAIAMRSEGADLICYGETSEPVKFSNAESVLKILERFRQIGGTNTGGALSRWYARHDRVVIVTDEQTSPGLDNALAFVPRHVPVITFNVAGYRVGHAESGTPTRITIGSLSDVSFKLLPVLEKRAAGHWPF